MNSMRKNSVTIPYTDTATSIKRSKWTTAYTTGPYKMDYTCNIDGSIKSITYFFNNKDDVFLFKMRWG